MKTLNGRPQIIQTKHLIRKVKQRFTYKCRGSARQLTKSLRVFGGTMRRIIPEDLHLHAYHATNQSIPIISQNSSILLVMNSANTEY